MLCLFSSYCSAFVLAKAGGHVTSCWRAQQFWSRRYVTCVEWGGACRSSEEEKTSLQWNVVNCRAMVSWESVARVLDILYHLSLTIKQNQHGIRDGGLLRVSLNGMYKYWGITYLLNRDLSVYHQSLQTWEGWKNMAHWKHLSKWETNSPPPPEKDNVFHDCTFWGLPACRVSHCVTVPCFYCLPVCRLHLQKRNSHMKWAISIICITYF